MGHRKYVIKTLTLFFLVDVSIKTWWPPQNLIPYCLLFKLTKMIIWLFGSVESVLTEYMYFTSQNFLFIFFFYFLVSLCMIFVIFIVCVISHNFTNLTECRSLKVIHGSVRIITFYYIHFEITTYPCNLIGSQQCDLFQIALFFALNRTFFSANEDETEKQNNQSDFKD